MQILNPVNVKIAAWNGTWREALTVMKGIDSWLRNFLFWDEVAETA
jgi:hypothetical protein